MTVRPINLALQGGGAHGAFTWGVLDRLLEEEALSIEGISGTSAGAMNGAVLVSGWVEGGRDGAKAALEAFWRDVSQSGRFGMFPRTPLDKLLAGWNIDQSPQTFWADTFLRLFSPYQLNPFDYHPLADALAAVVKPEHLNDAPPIKLFVGATDVESGKIRIFKPGELSIDALLASACLPHLFKAVHIDGRYYWDGGYMGNPAIFPLIYECRSPDVAIVQINVLNRPGEPRTSAQILDRLNEITFNASLMHEMRAIAFVARLVEQERLDRKRYKRMRMHWIGDEAAMMDLGFASKLNTDWALIANLREKGRDCAEAWLAANLSQVGKASTIDLRAMFF